MEHLAGVPFSVFDVTAKTWSAPRGPYVVRRHPERRTTTSVAREMKCDDGTWLAVETRGPEAIGTRHKGADVDARIARTFFRALTGTPPDTAPWPEPRDVLVDATPTSWLVIDDGEHFAMATTALEDVRVIVTGRFDWRTVALERVARAPEQL